jgi:integrase
MSKTQANARRKRVPGAANRNIYAHRNAAGEKIYEVGYRNGDGRQTFETIGPKISEARRARDDLLARRGRGEKPKENPRLKFGEAANRWLAERVVDLRPQTRNGYRNSIEKHLRPRFGSRRLDRIEIDDWARLIRELRAEGRAESTIETNLKAGRGVYRFAARRMGWHGVATLSLLEPSERPKVTERPKRRLFTAAELEQTLAVAHEPYRTLFSLGAVVGPRISEALGLTLEDLDLSDLEEATVNFLYQVDRKGVRQKLKTEESQREVEIPYSLARMLAGHLEQSPHKKPGDFVFCTSSGKALSQRNVARELRRAQKRARDAQRNPTFPILHEKDAEGNPVKVPRGAVPSFHSLRHGCASDAIAEGEGAEEIAWQLGHKDATVTRKIYIHEVKSAERSARRRARMESRYAPLLVSG